jgi:hypothetical protein
LIDKVVDYLPGWKASLKHKFGRLVMVKVVLTTVPIYLMIGMDLPKWVIKAIDKWRRGFLWKGQEQQNGVNVASEKVLRLLQYGGHIVHNLESLGWALHIRSFGHKKTDASRSWAGLPIQAPQNDIAHFNDAVETLVDNGESTNFWSNRWLQGRTISEIAPNLFNLISKREVKQRTVGFECKSVKRVAVYLGVG